MFSFNSPFGACKQCLGLGYLLNMDPDLVIPDKSLSVLDGAIVTMGSTDQLVDATSGISWKALRVQAKHSGRKTPEKGAENLTLWI